MATTVAPNPLIAPQFQAGMKGLGQPTVAPVPATMSPQLRAQRQANVPAVSPKTSTMAPIAYAQQQYQEPGDPFTAFASGWVNASASREQQTEEQARLAEQASALEGYPDLQKYVSTGAMDMGNAVRIKETRDAALKAEDRKAEIGDYLNQLAGTDERYGKLSEAWAAGLLDEDGLSKALIDIDKPPTQTDDQRELAQINEERAAKGIAPLSMEEFKTPAAKPPDVFGNEKDLFQQYSNSDPVKTYETVKTSFERLKESAAQQSGAGDLGMIYGYMKMLDPGSVVRESEFAMAAQAGDFGEQVQGMVSRILSGERLPESQRQEFLKNAEGLYRESASNLTDINAQFEERAKGAGVDPTRFIRQPESYQPTATSVPSPDANGGSMPAPASKEEYDQLPSGTVYTAPDGSVRTKP